jgi:aryl-alcohol dehydrogenase-like predicted oxidoreductase
MGTLASGYLTPDEAFAYVRTLPAVKSLVVGASSREHIAETFDAVARKF